MSVPFDLTELLSWTGGTKLQGPENPRFHGVSIDSRHLSEGCLFVAIRGERFDAHEFLLTAVEGGARGLLVSKEVKLPELPADCAVVGVEDTTEALGRLAAGHRAPFEGKVLAITGSNGKTTTKEMCAAILEVAGPCLKTRGNLNNQFGLPLTLLSREADDHSAVVEIGMNHRGEIAPLVGIARPDVGIITNVGTAHIEFLGSQDEIALEKGDLVANLGPDSVAVLNADDARVMSQRARCPGRVISYGLDEAADVRAERVTPLGDRGFAYDLVIGGNRHPVHVAGLGEPTVINSLAAAAGAFGAGWDIEAIALGLSRYEPIGGRMEKVALPRNIIVINDTYNANPQSMSVALQSLARLKGEARGIAVLGDMGELGATAEEAHRGNGRLVAELQLSYLFALGRWSETVRQGALEAGMDETRIVVGEDHEALTRQLSRILLGNDWVLVKGSRAMGMERIVEMLAESLR